MAAFHGVMEWMDALQTVFTPWKSAEWERQDGNALVWLYM
jgi:hypothetical protein